MFAHSLPNRLPALPQLCSARQGTDLYKLQFPGSLSKWERHWQGFGGWEKRQSICARPSLSTLRGGNSVVTVSLHGPSICMQDLPLYLQLLLGAAAPDNINTASFLGLSISGYGSAFLQFANLWIASLSPFVLPALLTPL